MHETKLQLELQQCQEVFSVFSISFISYNNFPLLSGGGGGPRSCLGLFVSGPTCSSSVHYLQILKDQVGLFLGNVILLSCE